VPFPSNIRWWLSWQRLHNRLHLKCAWWIGEGRHLDLLKMNLHCGFNPSGTDSPLFQKWPSPCSPNWISEESTKDSFFIEFPTILSIDNPGECIDSYIRSSYLWPISPLGFGGSILFKTLFYLD
jgi:hypothetical protein